MNLLKALGFNGNMAGTPCEEIPDIFPMPILMAEFVTLDTQIIYTRILTDVLDRTEGLPEEILPMLWDNCVASELPDGLVTMLAKAMVAKADLFIVYDRSVKVVRAATSIEKTQIKADYEKANKSSVGVFVSFKNYKLSDMVRLYSALEFCAVSGLYKSGNLSKAIQLKISDLRASVGAMDSGKPQTQAVAIAKGLGAGRDVMMDAKDEIVTTTPDISAAQSSMELIAQKRSFYLGLPASYITGQQSKGLGDTGEGDAKAIERGLRTYFFSIVKPTLEAVFNVKSLTFESDDFRSLGSSLEALKTFELTSDDLVSREDKRTITHKLFGLPPETEGDKKAAAAQKANAEAMGAQGTGPGTKAADTAMNGAQVTSLVDVVSRVVLKEIPAQSAQAILETAFMLSPEDAAQMVNPAQGFTAPPKPGPAIPVPSAAPVAKPPQE